MTDNPPRNSVGPGNSIQTPYGPAVLPTTQLVRAVLWGTWAILFVLGLVYVHRYALNTPFVDEWAFVPVLFGEEPVGPWLWDWHNEHRFPLSRVVYVALFRLTGDLRGACYFNFVGISLLAAGMMCLARRVRGRTDFTDVVFPLLLMHTGQGENLYMGYQVCFLLVTALAGLFLCVVVTTTAENHFRRGGQAGLIGLWAADVRGGWAFVYGGRRPCGWSSRPPRDHVAVPPWVLILIGCLTPSTRFNTSMGTVGRAPPGECRRRRVGPIGLQRRRWRSLLPATGAWPVAGIAVVAAGLYVVGLLGRRLLSDDWPRSLGLLAVGGASAAVAFGIGWGRSGFHDDMGFAWRYGWLTVPAVLAGYFALLTAGGRIASFGPMVLAVALVPVAVVNELSGSVDGKAGPGVELVWEADVQPGRLTTTPGIPLLGRRPRAGRGRRADHAGAPVFVLLAGGRGGAVNGFALWPFLLPVAGLVLFLGTWWLYRLGREVQTEGAREAFRLQRQRLAEVFMKAAVAAGKPRGLPWVSCQVTDDFALVGDRKTRKLSASYRNDQFEPEPGHGRRQLPRPRPATAVFTSGVAIG